MSKGTRALAAGLVVGLLGVGLFAIPAAAETTAGAYTYADNGNGTATLTQYAGPAVDVTIPSTIGGLTVTAIGDYAFQGSRWGYQLQSVVIPSTVTTIGQFAFEANGLTTVTIPDSVTSIGVAAFGLNPLQTVTLSKSLTALPYAAFYNTNLTSVTIPASVTAIADYVFTGGYLSSAVFLGNAPATVTDAGTGNSSFIGPNAVQVHYDPHAAGWSNPWHGYPTVGDVAAPAPVPPLAVSPVSGIAMVGANYSVTATLRAPTGQPQSGIVLNAVSKASTAATTGLTLSCSTASCLTDANGRVTFTYTSITPGPQSITVWVVPASSTTPQPIPTIGTQPSTGPQPGDLQVQVSVLWSRTQSTVWTALGDSYSAGVGTPGVAGTSGDNACSRRSAASYAGQARSTEVAAGHTIAFNFVACAGATTADILSRGQSGTGQPPQLDYAKFDAPDLATLTIGGNDIGFPTTVSSCVAKTFVPTTWSWIVPCPVDSNSMSLTNPQPGERASWDGLFDRLVKTYVQIRRTQPTGGQLYVMSYPVPFENPKRWDPSSLDGLGTCNSFNSTDARLANATAVRLGDTIYQAVQEANKETGGGVTFVDWRPPVTTEIIKGRSQRVAYDSNGLCSRNPSSSIDMNGLLLLTLKPGLTQNDSFHPTSIGYATGAAKLTDALKSFGWK